MEAATVKSLIEKYAGGTTSKDIKDKIGYFMLENTLFIYTDAYTRMEIDGDVILCYKEFELAEKSPVKNEETQKMEMKAPEFLSDIVDLNCVICLHLKRPESSDKEKLNSLIVDQMLPME